MTGAGAGLAAAGGETGGFGAGFGAAAIGGFGPGFGAAIAAGFLAGFATAAGFLAGVRAAVLALAFVLVLLFAAGLRAADARRPAVADFRPAGFRAADLRAAGFRADALVAFGLRDAAARLVFPGFLDFVAFAMIDLPILWTNLSDATPFLARSYYYS